METPRDAAAILTNARKLDPEIRAAADAIETERQLPNVIVDAYF